MCVRFAWALAQGAAKTSAEISQATDLSPPEAAEAPLGGALS